jgi:hypothetical protein
MSLSSLLYDIDPSLKLSRFRASSVLDPVTWRVMTLTSSAIERQIEYLRVHIDDPLVVHFSSIHCRRQVLTENFLEWIIPKTRGLHLQDGLIDPNHLKRAQALEVLIAGPKANINLPNPEKLSVLAISDLRIVNSARLVNLLSLRIWGKKWIDGGEPKFSHCPRLQELGLIQTPIAALDALINLPLCSLELAYAPKLVNLEGLTAHTSALRKLELCRCKNIQSWAPLINLHKLSHLDIEGCSDIPSISFMKNLENLSYVRVSDTNIIDGGVAWLRSKLSPDNIVVFPNKRHYDAKF